MEASRKQIITSFIGLFVIIVLTWFIQPWFFGADISSNKVCLTTEQSIGVKNQWKGLHDNFQQKPSWLENRFEIADKIDNESETKTLSFGLRPLEGDSAILWKNNVTIVYYDQRDDVYCSKTTSVDTLTRNVEFGNKTYVFDQLKADFESPNEIGEYFIRVYGITRKDILDAIANKQPAKIHWKYYVTEEQEDTIEKNNPDQEPQPEPIDPEKQQMILEGVEQILFEDVNVDEIFYRPILRKPEFVEDENTTLLLNFENGLARNKQADFAQGDTTIAFNNSDLTSEGVQGPFTFAKQDNLDLEKFTVEAIMRIPNYSQFPQDHKIADWSTENNYFLPITFNRYNGAAGFSLSQNLQGPNRLEKRVDIQSYTGLYLLPTVKNNWFYFSISLDIPNQKASTVIRDLEGNLLGETLYFIPKGYINNFHVRNLPENEQQAAFEAFWQYLKASIYINAPEDYSFGDDLVEIQKFRISNIYRDIFDYNHREIYPKNSFPPEALGTNIQTRIRQGELGYDRHGQQWESEIEEKYVQFEAGDVFEIPLKDINIGLYTLYIYGSIDLQGRAELPRVWRPTPMEFQLLDENGTEIENGLRQLKQGVVPRKMQGFHFHIPEKNNYTARFKLADNAQENIQVSYVKLVDELEGLPDEKIKTEQTIFDTKNAKEPVIDEARLARDELLWNALPTINRHFQFHGTVKEFARDNIPESILEKAGNFNTTAIAIDGQRDYFFDHLLEIVNTDTGEITSHDDIQNHKPWNAELSDDGTGIYLPKSEYPELEHDIYYAPRAELLAKRYWNYRHQAITQRLKAYESNGNPEYAHDAAIALVRIAYDYPAMYMNLHEFIRNSHSPQFDYNQRRDRWLTGKYFYSGWAGSNFIHLLEDYDKVYPYIKDNQELADSINKFIPWIETPDDVIRMLDRYLVAAGVRDFMKEISRAGGGVLQAAASIFGYKEVSWDWLDYSKVEDEIYPISEQPYQQLYAHALNRDGSHFIGSFLGYGRGFAFDTIKKAYAIFKAKQEGFDPPMDLSDVNKYPKLQRAIDSIVDLYTAGGHPVTRGDAGGNGHRQFPEYILAARNDELASRMVFEMFGDKRHAWLLHTIFKVEDPAILAAIEGMKNPILHLASRVYAGIGSAMMEFNSESDDFMKKTSAVMHFGYGYGHKHQDTLDLNFYALGLPIAVDLGQRSEGDNWSSPGGPSVEVHNHAYPLEAEDKRFYNTDAWLQTFEPPYMRGGATAINDTENMDRKVLMMEIGDTKEYYAFDVQRLFGGKDHVWAFHGAETDFQEGFDINMDTQSAENEPFLERTLSGTKKKGIAPEKLEATWTMGRKEQDVTYTIKGGGTFKTYSTEKVVLGEHFDENLERAHIRSTLLGRSGDDVFVGDAFSNNYRYSFPFLWVINRLPQNKTTLYPAIYDWWRGEESDRHIQNIELLSQEPVVVRVTLKNGQVDTFLATEEGIAAISKNADSSTRYIKMNGLKNLNFENIIIAAQTDFYRATITDIDYINRTLTVDNPLPKDPKVLIQNEGRKTYVELFGEGIQFTIKDDLLVGEGEVFGVSQLNDGTISIKTSGLANPLHSNSGNRHPSGYSRMSENGQWLFQSSSFDTPYNYIITKQPENSTLESEIFTDDNGDGLRSIKIYEAGIGFEVVHGADIEITNINGQFEVKSNVGFEGVIDEVEVSI